MLLFLVYHKVGGNSEGQPYTVSPELLRSHLQIIKSIGIPVVDPRTLTENRGRQDGLVLTFDDGTADHHDAVLPLLDRFNFRALFYVPTGKLNRRGRLTDDQVRFSWREGHTIGSHGHSHKRLDVLPSLSIMHELKLSRNIIFDIVGEPPVHFAPAGGFYNRSVEEIARETGYGFLRTMEWGFNREFNPARIAVVPVTNALSEELFKIVLQGKWEGLLKFVYFIKNVVRATLSSFFYDELRKRVIRGKVL